MRLVPMLREHTVFNVSQCEDLPYSVTTSKPIRVRNSDTRDELADQFLHSTGADFRAGAEAYYVPSRDFISMAAFEAFKSTDHFYKVAFHELTHGTAHGSRLDRDLKDRFGSCSYAAEELVAELSAAFLSAEFGFDGDLRHAGYISHWIELLKADKRAFFTAFSRASKAADCLRGLALAEPTRRHENGELMGRTRSLRRSSMSIRPPVAASRCLIERSKRSAKAEPVGSGTRGRSVAIFPLLTDSRFFRRYRPIETVRPKVVFRLKKEPERSTRRISSICSSCSRKANKTFKFALLSQARPAYPDRSSCRDMN